MSTGRRLAATVLLALVALPLGATAWLAADAALQAPAWRQLLHHPQTGGALAYSLWTGLASTLLAWLGCALLLAQGFVRQSLTRVLRAVPFMLATPHAALAIGLAFVLAPSGWLLRLVSPWATGWQAPPDWPTVQDPWGLGLIAALAAKELPFLLWTAATQLQRSDVHQQLSAGHRLALTLGYSPHRAFWHVVWPPIAARMGWPLFAVLAYGLTVVDMALIIGPARPPTLAVLAWQWLQDADPATQAQGAAAGGLLTLTVGLCAALAWTLERTVLRPWHARWRRQGRRGRVETPSGRHLSRPRLAPWWHLPRLPGLHLLWALYAAVLLALAVGSVAGVWPFPDLWPQQWTLGAWQSVAASHTTLVHTAGLACAAAALALAWSIAWLELAPPSWDALLRPVLYAPLVLPAVLWVVGLYALALALHLEGRWAGLLLAHTLAALPYVLLALSPAYQGFDPRYRALSASLGHGVWRFLWCVKWPLLRRSLASSAAVGFAVSVAQFLPTLYVGAGRYASVTTEAVTLAAGGQRSLTSAYAWLQFVLPVVGFALAAWAGQARRFRC